MKRYLSGKLRRGPSFASGSTIARAQVEALYVVEPPPLNASRPTVLAQVERLRRPAIYGFPEFVRDGGLVAEQLTKYELSINLKAARALGMSVPIGLLLRADEAIE